MGACGREDRGWKPGRRRHTTGWRIKAGWLGALPPRSSVLAQRTGLQPRRVPRACGLTWTLAPLPLPPQPPQPVGELGPWNCLREERGGAERRRAWRWPQAPEPLPVGTSTGPTWSLPAWGAVGAQPRLGPVAADPLTSPQAGPAPPTLAPPRPLFIHVPQLSRVPRGGPGAGPVPNKHRPRLSRALCGGLGPASSPRRPVCCLPGPEGGRATRCIDIPFIPSLVFLAAAL